MKATLLKFTATEAESRSDAEPTPAPRPSLMTIDDIAFECRVSVRTVKRWSSARAIPGGCRLGRSVRFYWSQKADDRCVEDDDKLYAAAGLPKCDRRVGNKEEMLANCRRFIEKRCDGGGWPSYRELEEKLNTLRAHVVDLQKHYDDYGSVDSLGVDVAESIRQVLDECCPEWKNSCPTTSPTPATSPAS